MEFRDVNNFRWLKTRNPELDFFNSEAATFVVYRPLGSSRCSTLEPWGSYRNAEFAEGLSSLTCCWDWRAFAKLFVFFGHCQVQPGFALSLLGSFSQLFVDTGDASICECWCGCPCSLRTKEHCFVGSNQCFGSNNTLNTPPHFRGAWLLHCRRQRPFPRSLTKRRAFFDEWLSEQFLVLVVERSEERGAEL